MRSAVKLLFSKIAVKVMERLQKLWAAERVQLLLHATSFIN